jgi:hypothetical protein
MVKLLTEGARPCSHPHMPLLQNASLHLLHFWQTLLVPALLKSRTLPCARNLKHTLYAHDSLSLSLPTTVISRNKAKTLSVHSQTYRPQYLLTLFSPSCIFVGDWGGNGAKWKWIQLGCHQDPHRGTASGQALETGSATYLQLPCSPVTNYPANSWDVWFQSFANSKHKQMTLPASTFHDHKLFKSDTMKTLWMPMKEWHVSNYNYCDTVAILE